ncbi:MAG: hypothetical protein IB618_01430 [Candidatus Pacearchaeota archaeon]|nr:MAG: hypothetical protein IB618_01430 [Candidatus Pacearchaeota archaeon]
MKKLLEERLIGLNEEIFEEIKRALSIPYINPKKEWRSMPYLKDDLNNAIVGYLSRISRVSRNFKSNLYSTINKEPLKRVYYGIKSTDELPKEFMNSLTDWEKVYFFAGRWDIRKPNFTEPIDVLTVKHVYEGLNLVNKHHFKRKAKGQYTRQLELPERKEVREAYKRIIKAYEEKLVPKKEERKTEEKQKIVQEALF